VLKKILSAQNINIENCIVYNAKLTINIQKIETAVYLHAEHLDNHILDEIYAASSTIIFICSDINKVAQRIWHTCEKIDLRPSAKYFAKAFSKTDKEVAITLQICRNSWEKTYLWYTDESFSRIRKKTYSEIMCSNANIFWHLNDFHVIKYWLMSFIYDALVIKSCVYGSVANVDLDLSGLVNFVHYEDLYNAYMILISENSTQNKLLILESVFILLCFTSKSS